MLFMKHWKAAILSVFLGAIAVTTDILQSGTQLIMNFFQNLQINFTGDNVAGNKNVIEKKPFSEKQYIIPLPPRLGGNNRLILDNAAILKLTEPYNENEITLILDVATKEFAPVNNENFTIEGAQISYTSGKDKYYRFDLHQNNRHTIQTADRTFNVTLFKISELKTSGVSKALQYEFGISERI